MKNTFVLLSILAFTTINSLHADDLAWDYSEKKGPDHWSEISPDFALCGSGKSQSPINIDTSSDKNDKLPVITFSYYSKPKFIVNMGTSIRVTAGDNNKLVFNDDVYTFKYMDLHVPSEHQIDGKQYQLEAQLIHEDTMGKLLIVSSLFKVNKPNSALAQLLEQLPNKIGEERNIEASTQNTTCGMAAEIGTCGLLPVNKEYYYYVGSLTTPPCTEGVNWVVMKRSLSVSQEQINKLVEAIGSFNQRPVQALNTRHVAR